MAEYKKNNKADKKKQHEEAVKGIKRCVDFESSERAKMLDDLRFATLDQWPSDIRNEREGDAENGPRPCLTIDKINQYIVQVVNDMRQGKPGIKVRPVDDASDVETAKILQGLVRNIEDQSSADIAYMTAGESAAKIGLGYFRITTEYVSDDSFDQEIVIKPIPNTFSTYLGPHIMPDGSDAEEGYIVEQMPKADFEARYPKAKVDKKSFDDLDKDQAFWLTDETVTVVERFYIRKSYEEVLFLDDGSQISRADYDEWPEEAGPKPEIEDTRFKTKKSLHWCKLTGAEILEERDLPGQYIPIIEVVGRETHIDGQRRLWGLVRPAKDSLRMYNYWASTITEKLALAPKAPFIGAAGQFKGHEDRWKKANRVNYSYLEYEVVDVNGNAIAAPKREQPAPVEVAMVQQLAQIENDVKASLGMYKAALGESESQQSGRAILALQRESDTGTFHFGANLGVSIRHAGRVIIDMIPHYYDTRRIVRILGEDGEMQAVELDPEQEVSMRQIQTSRGIKRIFNPGVGKYDVTTTVGPSYNTKRMEAAATYVELAKGAADPASAAALRYLTVKNSDFGGSDEGAKLLKALLPPQALQALDSGAEQIPPAAMAKIQQLEQQVQVMNQAGQEMGQRLQEAESGVAQAQMKTQAEHQARMRELDMERQVEEAKAKLARDKAMAEIELKRAIAVAELEIERMKIVDGASAEVDAAIAKVQNMIALHETKMQGVIEKDAAGREDGEAKASSEQSMAAMQEMHRAFLDGVGQIVAALSEKKKRIEMVMPDGRKATAEVTAG
jgi:hypothetical protein